MSKKRKQSITDKLYAGWWWFFQCAEEWGWCMTHPENTGGDFFCHINSDYVKYEEDTYYTK